MFLYLQEIAIIYLLLELQKTKE